MLLAANLARSRTGLMFRAMRDSSEAAMSLAIDLQWLRTRVFVLCALFGSLAGNLFAHYTSFVSVQSFTVEKSFSFLLISVLGGVRSVFGMVIGRVVHHLHARVPQPARRLPPDPVRPRARPGGGAACPAGSTSAFDLLWRRAAATRGRSP